MRLDFLSEVLKERTAENPKFPLLVSMARIKSAQVRMDDAWTAWTKAQEEYRKAVEEHLKEKAK